MLCSVTLTFIESITNTCDQSDTKSNPNPNPIPTTKQHTVVNIQPNIVICPMYPQIIHMRQMQYAQ